MTLPTFEDLCQARDNMWKQQKKLDCYPIYDVIIYRNEDRNSLCTFAMNDQSVAPYRPARAPYLCCFLDEKILGSILAREKHWNDMELGGWIEFDRKGSYNPDVHMLLSFFQLPRSA